MNNNLLFKKLNGFIKKYYQNELIKGGIYTISLLVFLFLLFAVIEYFFSFGVKGRSFLFFSYISLSLIILTKLIVMPMLHLLKIGKTLSYKAAARIIGKHFSEIDDKLLNLLELSEISNTHSELIIASINQKTKKLSLISFKNAINFSINKKHLKWVLVPIIIIFVFIISGKDYILTESSARIINHNTFFEPEAPFNYILLNNNLSVKQFNDFLLEIEITGNEIPDEIFINSAENTFKMNNLGNNKFNYLFSRVHSNITFQFSGGGYLSQVYTIKSLLQPKVTNMQISIAHPKYTNKEREIIENNGDIIISQGSIITWSIQLENINSCFFTLDNKIIKQASKDELQIQKQILKNSPYSIISSNANNLSDTLNYFITSVADEFPKINLSQSYDTLNNTHLFSGTIEDDYLLNKLEFIYSYNSIDTAISKITEIIIQKINVEQFFHAVNFSDLNITPGDELTYYFKVWDNDQINGSKFTKSALFSYKEPSINELIKKKDFEDEKTKANLNNSISLAKEIQKEIRLLNKKILEKKEMGWQEKQKAKEILKKQKELEEHITNTQKKNSENLNLKKKLTPSTLEKQKQLEELMNNVLDEEIKTLIKEMQKMISESDKEKLKDLLEKLDKENSSLEKELDRELELFKQLEFEQKTEEVLNKLSKIKKEQQSLKKKTDQRKGSKNELAEEQQSLNKEMNSIKNDLKELRDKNIQLENKHEIPKTQKLEEDITKKMQDSKEALEKGMSKKSSKSQQSAIDEIEQLEQKLQSMQQSLTESKAEEDMQALRKILENLITLSFDQEDLMNNVTNTPRNSPEFVEIVKQQKNLSDDSKVIEDSLFALSKRVVEIEAAINKEITSIKINMKKATNKLEGRDVKRGVEKQQFVMTSTNNLALLLSEILEQMQKQLDMSSSKCNKPKNCNNPKNSSKPSISEIQKAQKNLNAKMKKGKKGDEKKQAEKQSKELINLAKQQQKIRTQLMDLRDEEGKNGDKGKIDKILQDMEENERDIINNKITQQTINRQENILTRLLDYEKSDRERDLDDQREATEWDFKINNTSQEFLKYQKQKRAQEELLKTTPIQLTPFYKKKVNTYFKNIIND